MIKSSEYLKTIEGCFWLYVIVKLSWCIPTFSKCTQCWWNGDVRFWHWSRALRFSQRIPKRNKSGLYWNLGRKIYWTFENDFKAHNHWHHCQGLKHLPRDPTGYSSRQSHIRVPIPNHCLRQNQWEAEELITNNSALTSVIGVLCSVTV